MISDQNFHW